MNLGPTLDLGDVVVGGEKKSVLVEVVDAQGDGVPGAWIGFDYPHSPLVGLNEDPVDSLGLLDADIFAGIGVGTYLRADSLGRLRIDHLSADLMDIPVAVGSPRHVVVGTTLGALVGRRVVLEERLRRLIHVVTDHVPATPVRLDLRLGLAPVETEASGPTATGPAAQRMIEDLGDRYVVPLEDGHSYMAFVDAPGTYELVARLAGAELGRRRISIASATQGEVVDLVVRDGRAVTVRIRCETQSGEVALPSSIRRLTVSGPDGEPSYEWALGGSSMNTTLWFPWTANHLQVAAPSAARLPCAPIMVPISADGGAVVTCQALLEGAGTLVVMATHDGKPFPGAQLLLRLSRQDVVGRGWRGRSRGVTGQSRGPIQVHLPPGDYNIRGNVGVGWSASTTVTIRSGAETRLELSFP